MSARAWGKWGSQWISQLPTGRGRARNRDARSIASAAASLTSVPLPLFPATGHEFKVLMQFNSALPYAIWPISVLPPPQ
jgi:hypothetical protein